MTETIEITVRGFHLDAFNHVNNARFLEFMEDARWAIFKAALLKTQQLNCAMAIVNININYRHPALLYQRLRVGGDISKIGNKSFVMTQHIHCIETDQLVADADLTCVIVDNQTGKAIPINDEWQAVLQMR